MRKTKFDVVFADPVTFYSSEGSLLVISRRAYTREEAARLINEYQGNLDPEDDIRPAKLTEEWVAFGFWGEENGGEGEAVWHGVQGPGPRHMPVWMWER